MSDGMLRKTLLLILLSLTLAVNGQFAPPSGEDGTTAVHKDSSAIVAWATILVDFARGPLDAAYPDGGLASYGEADAALYAAEGTSTEVVSLGDGGSITLSFDFSIEDLPGPDFVIFENSFSDEYLEFAHVEVSTDGEKFVRIPSISNIPIEEQTATYANSDPTLVHNLAGKYRQGYGTPFDLQDIADSTGVDLSDINFIRIIDVVGSINPDFGTKDSEGNIINDPYPTDFESGGFDLDAVGVIHSTDPTLNIEKNKQEFVVYPNPSNGILNYSTQKPLSGFAIVDMTGKRIFLRPNATGQIDLSLFNPGIYILVATTAEGEVYRTQLVLK
jgi:hypothetical protein